MLVHYLLQLVRTMSTNVMLISLLHDPHIRYIALQKQGGISGSEPFPPSPAIILRTTGQVGGRSFTAGHHVQQLQTILLGHDIALCFVP